MTASSIQVGPMLLCAFVGMSTLQNAQAEPLVVYDPTGTYTDASSIPPAVVANGITASNVDQTLPTGHFNSTVWPFQAPVGSVDTNRYMTITLQATSGLNLKSLNYSAYSYEASSKLALHLRSSVDGFSKDIGSVNHTGAGGWTAEFDLCSLPRNVTGPVVFRLYTENSGTADDWIDLDSSANATAGLVVSDGSCIATPAVSDCLFNWAERNYSQFFSPAGGTSATFASYYYRHYPATGNYVATSNDQVWVMGSSFSDTPLRVGLAIDFIGPSGCSR